MECLIYILRLAYTVVRMAERSKAPDSRLITFPNHNRSPAFWSPNGGVGSNPTPDNVTFYDYFFFCIYRCSSYRGLELSRGWVTERMSCRGFELKMVWATEILSYQLFELPGSNYGGFKLPRVSVIVGLRNRGVELPKVRVIEGLS